MLLTEHQISIKNTPEPEEATADPGSAFTLWPEGGTSEHFIECNKWKQFSSVLWGLTEVEN